MYITDSKIPQAIAVNVGDRTFYQNDTYSNVNEFILGVESGAIELQKQKDKSSKGMLEMMQSWYMRNKPLSAVLVTLLLALIVLVLSAIIGLRDQEREIMTEVEFKNLQKEGARKSMKSLKED